MVSPGVPVVTRAVPSWTTERAVAACDRPRGGIKVLGFNGLPDTGCDLPGPLNPRRGVCGRQALGDRSGRFCNDRELQLDSFARQQTANQLAVQQQQLFGGIFSLSGFPVGHRDGLVGFDDQVEAGQQVGNSRDWSAAELFFHAEDRFP